MSDTKPLHSARRLAVYPLRNKGFGLVEIMIAIAVLSVIVATLSSVMQFASSTTRKSREQTYAANMSERFFTRLNSIPYPYVFSCDSSSANYGLNGTFGPVTNQVPSYPYRAILDELKETIRSLRFDRFTVNVQFMIRDTGDLNHDGRTTDLRPFTDSNNDLIDDLSTCFMTNDLGCRSGQTTSASNSDCAGHGLRSANSTASSISSRMTGR